MKRKLAFYWLIAFVSVTTSIFSHVKDKNDMFTARGEDMIFQLKGKSWYFISIYIIIEDITWPRGDTKFLFEC